MFYIDHKKEAYTALMFLSDIVIDASPKAQRKSSPRLAKRASMVLRSKHHGTILKSLAGSVLSQAAPKAKLLKAGDGSKKRKYVVNQSYRSHREKFQKLKNKF